MKIELTEQERSAIHILSLDRIEQSREIEKHAKTLSNLLARGVLYLDGLGIYRINNDLID